MIKFGCPTCGNSLSAPEHKSGSLSTCPACGQMVQVPAIEGGGEKPGVKPRREGMRAFWALVRFFLWGLVFAGLILTVANYFLEIEKKAKDDQLFFALQTLIYILGGYYLARTFDDSTKSLEELCARLRRKR
ncbi:MAG: hypothetical protein K2R98_03755 [Gemmataceae bacterium]|nr:hypothetical protein [Gemmataceae bacterium]